MGNAIHKLFHKEQLVNHDAVKKPTTGYERRIAINCPLTNLETTNWEISSLQVDMNHSNKIRTSKYTIYNFLFKNLYLQYKRLANLFFTVLVLIQIYPDIQVVSPIVAAIPVMFILGISLLKDVVEDWKRHVSDRELNDNLVFAQRPVRKEEHPLVAAHISKKPKVLVRASRNTESFDATASVNSKRSDVKSEEDVAKPKKVQKIPKFSLIRANSFKDLRPQHEHVPAPWIRCRWRDLLIGDIVCLQANEPVPADMIILSTSEPESACYVETKNLDGETNLKIRKGVFSDFVGIGGPKEGQIWTKIKGWINTEPRSTNIDSFKGSFDITEGYDELSIAYKSKLASSQNSLSSAEGAEKKAMELLTDKKNISQGDVRTIASIKEEPETDDKAHHEGQVEKPSLSVRTSSMDKLPHVEIISPTITREDKVVNSKIIPVDARNLLLRGCVLRNTKFITGVVIYTGEDTKLMLNSGQTPNKRTRIEMKMNPQIVMNMCFLFIVCLICAVRSGIWSARYTKVNVPFAVIDPTAVTEGDNPFVTGLKTFLVSAITFQNIIPISLYVSVEIIKTFQAYFIHQDKEMYDAKSNKPCIPRSWNLSDDLGQVECIFSDKTGTLTQNIMEFKRCSIKGIAYGLDLQDFEEGTNNEEEKEKYDASRKYEMIRLAEDAFPNKYSNLAKCTLIDPQLYSDLKDPQKAEAIKSFFRLLALCHTVLTGEPVISPIKLTKKSRRFSFTKTGKQKEPKETTVPLKDSVPPAIVVTAPPVTEFKKISYKAQSPDEEALVTCAKDLGFTFVEGREKSLKVDILGNEENYTILNILEFNSDRKRMSIILKDEQGRIRLLCKGADTVIFERLAKGQNAVEQMTLDHLNAFASEAWRFVSQEEYEQWIVEYESAVIDLNDRDARIAIVNDKIERNLELLGATAIEDKLQDGVPECIEALSQAGLKFCVLTGDKLETAKTIATSCNLITSSMTNMILEGNEDDIQENIMTLLEKCFQVERHVSVDLAENQATIQKDKQFLQWIREMPTRNESYAWQKIKEGLYWIAKYAYYRVFGKGNIRRYMEPVNNIQTKEDFALLIDGATLKHALKPENQGLIHNLMSRCKSVVCCRVSPLQKAQVVELIKKRDGFVTLAIGDGANDVHMIQTADIGIGISGQEGVQAVMASDYAIAQFKFLKRLLLVHGHWSYVRMSESTLLFFYKNIIFSLVMFYFQFYCGYTGTSPFDVTYMLYYNLVFTSLPALVMGIFEQDISDKWLMQYPQLYKIGLNRRRYTNKKFWLYNLDAVLGSMIIFYISIAVFSEGPIGTDGHATEISTMGNLMALGAVMTANNYSSLNTRQWTGITLAANTIPNIIFLLYCVLHGIDPTADTFNILETVLSNVSAYFLFAFVVIAPLLPRLAGKFAKAYLDPSDLQIISEESSMETSQQLARIKAPLIKQVSTSKTRFLKKAVEFFSSSAIQRAQSHTGAAFSNAEGISDIILGKEKYRRSTRLGRLVSERKSKPSPTKQT